MSARIQHINARRDIAGSKGEKRIKADLRLLNLEMLIVKTVTPLKMVKVARA